MGSLPLSNPVLEVRPQNTDSISGPTEVADRRQYGGSSAERSGQPASDAPRPAAVVMAMSSMELSRGPYAGRLELSPR